MNQTKAQEYPGIVMIEDVCFKANIPLMLIGPPGVGKTETILAEAAKHGYEVILLLASTMDPTDVSGLPRAVQMSQKDNGEYTYGTVYSAPDWQHRVMSGDKILLFFDEYSNASPAVRASLLTVIQNRIFPNGAKMPDATRILFAMNPPSQAADGIDLDPATKNRMFHFAWNPPVSDWVEGMRTAWGFADKRSDNEMFWKKRIAAFIEDEPSMLHVDPDVTATDNTLTNASEIEVDQSAYPTRRSWDNLSKALAVGDHKDPADEWRQDMLARASVGASAALSFREWMKKHSHISVDDVLADPSSVDWNSITEDEINVVFREAMNNLSPDNVGEVVALFDHVGGIESRAKPIVGRYISDIIKNGSVAVGKLRKDDAERAKQINADMLNMAKKYSGVAKAGYFKRPQNSAVAQ